jgi:uncharacterized protein involved in exopolysaccharide biosynthesis
MSALGALTGQPLAARLGWVLVHSIWQGAVVAVVFGMLRLGSRRCSANIRYLTACSALVILAAAPIATAIYGPIRLVPRSAMYVSLGRTPGLGSTAATQTQPDTSDFGARARLWLQDRAQSLERWLPTMVTEWLLGVLLLSCRWLQGCWWIRRVRTVQVKPLDPHWIAVLEYLKCRLDIRRSVGLVQSALADVPMVVGWLKPVILIPASTLAGLSPDQLEAILAHELAHVRRYDCLVNSLQNLLETLLFYHPAVWWISRCIREEREHCCDDLVLRLCTDRLVYARALFRLEELRGAPARLAFAASGGSLLQRIRRLLGGPPEVWPVTVREFGGLTLLAIGCVLLVTGACLMLVTETYSSTARIRVERQQPVIPAAGLGEQQIPSPYDPYFIQTEFEVLQSQVILGRVIEELKLNDVWGKKYPHVLKTQETMELLKRQMELRPVRNTSIIEIRVYDEDPQEAAQIANAIARIYANYRLRRREDLAGEGVESLVARLKEQDALMAQAQSNVDRLRVELKIPNDASAENQPTMLLSAETLRRVESLRLETQTEYVRSKTLLDKLKELKFEQLVQAIPATGIQDPNLSALLEQQNLADQKLVALQKEFGPQSSEVIRLSAQCEELKRKIQLRAEGILLGLDAKVTSLHQGLIDLSNEVAKATEADVLAANRREPYFQAQRELEERQRLRQMLQLKLASEKVDYQPPRYSLVEIVDEAIPALRPLSPNRFRGAALIGSGLLLCVMGLVLVRSGRYRTAPLASNR